MSKSVRYKEVSVVYSQFGRGETVVLLHGFLEERGMWNEFASILAESYNVITIDLLGQGDTDCLGYSHSMSLHAEAVFTVLKKEKVENCVVVGHSMGGYVALELARCKPTLIDGLVLFHSTSLADTEERKQDRERVIRLAQRNKDIYIRSVIPTLFADETLVGLKEPVQTIVKTASTFSEQGIVANIRGMMERDSRTDVLKDGAFPKMILHGEKDAVIPAEHVLEQAKLNNNISLRVVDGIGHMGHLEAPEDCLQLLSEFCQEVWKN